MREFTKVISEAFVNGLRPEDRALRNSPFLHEAFNVKARDVGLDFFEEITDPFSGNETVSFPFPQLYRGGNESLLLDETEIRTVDESGTPWTSSAITFDKAIPAGGVWHVADFKESWYLFNGECILAKIKDDINANEFLVNTDVDTNTGTNFRGRCVLGGINPTNIWPDTWDSVFDFWREKNTHLPEYTTDTPDKSYVMWGSIGGGDFPLWLFRPEIIRYGSFDRYTEDEYHLPVDSSFVIEMLKKNQLGFMPMPFQGEVLVVKELGNGIMAYCEDGIVYLPHISPSISRNDLIPPTFGLRKILATGVADRGAVGGTVDAHMFIDKEGSLWTIDSELSLDRLGYNEFFLEFLGKDMVFSFDPQHSEFYAATADDSYVLSNGLTKIRQHPTSLDHTGGALVGLFKEDADDSILIVSNPTDMNMRGVKTVVGVNLAVDSTDDVQVAFDFRYNSRDSFQRSHFQVVNKEGNAMLRVHGLEFRLVVKCAKRDGFQLDYAHIKWQGDDKRNIRGLGPAEEIQEVGA